MSNTHINTNDDSDYYDEDEDAYYNLINGNKNIKQLSRDTKVIKQCKNEDKEREEKKKQQEQ